MKTQRQLLGAKGERIAERSLKKKGYRLVMRNYTAAAGEADLVMSDGDILVFIEVKTRMSAEFVRPSDAVTPAKQRRYLAIAKQFLQEFQIRDRVVRFDVCEVVEKNVNHIVNAFCAEG